MKLYRVGAVIFRRLLVLLFALVFLVVGVAMSWFGWGELRKAQQSVNWPVTAGKVLSSEVVDAGDDNMQFDAAITFAYKIEGEILRSDKVQLGQWATSDVSGPRKMVRQFPKGKIVKVYYNPDDPAEAILLPGPTVQSWLIPGMGVVFFLFSGFIALAAVFGRAH